MKKVQLATILLVFVVAGYWLGFSDGLNGEFSILPQAAFANESDNEAVSPVKARERDTYYPNSEDLGPDEMRVIA